MDRKIVNKLNILERKILDENIANLTKLPDYMNLDGSIGNEWGGADVIITSVLEEWHKEWENENRIVIDLSGHEYDYRRRLVHTRHAKELSWLFYQLRDLFAEKIDYVSKYAFYGLLAQTAKDYFKKNRGKINKRDLLLCVLNSARDFNRF